MNAAVPELFERLSADLQARLAPLPDKPDETPDSTLRALWLGAAGVPASAMLAMRLPLPVLDHEAEARLHRLLAQRLDGVPLAHLTRRESFMGLELVAGPDALVPRRETELLAKAAIALVIDRDALVVDLCTGCGNLALAIAQRAPRARVFAADISPAAVALAQANADRLGLAECVRFRTGDLLAPFDDGAFAGNIDLLSCNPPYISSARVDAMAPEIAGHEPRLAFDGGPLGVTIVMRLLQQAPSYLRAGGWLAFEVGLGQGPGIVRRLQTTEDWRDVRPLTDAGGAIRGVLAQRTDARIGEAPP